MDFTSREPHFGHCCSNLRAALSAATCRLLPVFDCFRSSVILSRGYAKRVPGMITVPIERLRCGRPERSRSSPTSAATRLRFAPTIRRFSAFKGRDFVRRDRPFTRALPATPAQLNRAAEDRGLDPDMASCFAERTLLRDRKSKPPVGHVTQRSTAVTRGFTVGWSTA